MSFQQPGVHPDTMDFRRRFNGVGLREKMNTMDKLNEYLSKKSFPHRKMSAEELTELDQLPNGAHRIFFLQKCRVEKK